MTREIDILVVEPGKAPRPAKAEDTLDAFQKIVGGPIEAGCYLPQRVMLICNGELNGDPAEAQRSGFGGERRKGWSGRSPRCQAGTEQSGISFDEGLMPNRENPTDCRDFIAGTFLLCSFEGERFASLTAAQQKKFEAYFALPDEKGGDQEE